VRVFFTTSGQSFSVEKIKKYQPTRGGADSDRNSDGNALDFMSSALLELQNRIALNTSSLRLNYLCRETILGEVLYVQGKDKISIALFRTKTEWIVFGIR
jgi:hypothetical protein